MAAIVLVSMFASASPLPIGLAVFVFLTGICLLTLHVFTLGRFELHVFEHGLELGDRRTGSFRWFPRSEARVAFAPFRRVVLSSKDGIRLDPAERGRIETLWQSG